MQNKQQLIGKEQRLRQQIYELQKQWDLLSEILHKRETARIIETHPEEKMRLQHLIEELKTERRQIEQQLDDLENQLQNHYEFKKWYNFLSLFEKVFVTLFAPIKKVLEKINELLPGKTEKTTYKFGKYSDRLGQEIDALQKQWNILSQKLAELETSRILESRSDEKLRLEQLISRLKAERQQVEQQLHNLESQLPSKTNSRKKSLANSKGEQALNKPTVITVPKSSELPNLSEIREILQKNFSMNELETLSLAIGLDISSIQTGSISSFALDIVKNAKQLNKLEDLLLSIERIKPSKKFVEKLFEASKKTKTVRKFLLNAGFEIKTFFESGDFVALPTSVWRERFHKGIYVPVWLDTPLDNDAVNSICQKAKEYTDHALVVTDQQPKLDGWMAIASMRLNDTHPFVLIPITDSVINEGFVSKNERRTFANYIEKYLGKGYNPYDVHDPVFDALSFFGREGIKDEILSELKLGKRVGLFGLHKIGKSSVLKTLQKRAAFPVAYVYLEKNISLNDIYEGILKAWESDIHTKFPNFEWDKNTANSKASFKSRAKSLLERLEDVAPVPHLSVFLDEIETIIPYKEGDEGTLNCYVNLMDSLRGLQQETESLSLLVAGVYPTLARVNYFWGSQKNPMHQIIVEKFLPPLDRDDCEVMIRSLGKQIGLDYDDKTIEYIIRRSGAHPYLARQLCGTAYQKRKETGIMPFEIIQEAAEEFVYNPSRNDYFNDRALWGEVAKEDVWGKEIGELNHHILRKLAASEEGLSKAELSEGIERTAFEQSFTALKERSIINLLPDSNRYQITFELFKNWIRAHKLNEKEVAWQTHSISELPSRTTNLSDVGVK